MNESRGNPIKPLWERQFSFAYWDNKLNKINPYNPEDRLEAIYVAMQLSDLYTHIFTAQVRNPDQPMFLLKEETYGNHIRETLDKLSRDVGGESYVFVETLKEEPDGLISYEKVEDGFEMSLREGIAHSLLGCPVEFDEQNMTAELASEPDYYYGAANAILNFWRENKELLNDLKHGFRVLPFDAEALELWLDSGILTESEEIDQIRSLFESVDEDEWTLHFLRMGAEKAGKDVSYDYEVGLHIHQADIRLCKEFAKLTLNHLFNLFNHKGEAPIEQGLATLMGGDMNESGSVSIMEYLGEFKVVYNPENLSD